MLTLTLTRALAPTLALTLSLILILTLAKMQAFTSDDSVHYAGAGRVGGARPSAVPYANFALTPPMPDAFARGEK